MMRQHEAKTEIVKARMDAHLKADVSHILDTLGMNMSEAINAFFRQIKLRKGMPFEIRIPTATTKKALNDARARRTFKADSADALMNEIE
ncbi:MAG: type II toxin-antitoxin system RelB/DinJ family antitoxin [Pseudomonadota bacterium]